MAVSQVETTTSDAKSSKINTNPLSMALNSVTDAGTAAGVPLYRKAFFDAAFVAMNSDKLYMIEGLRSAIDDQARSGNSLFSSLLRNADTLSYSC